MLINGKQNKDKDIKDTIINDQNIDNSDVSKLQYGVRDMSYNGCEVIAVNNAMKIAGKSTSVANLVTDFQKCDGMWLGGLFGSTPSSIGRVLKMNDIEYKRVGLKDLDRNGIYIISYWTGTPIFSQIHTVAMTYNNGKYTTYNYYGDNDYYYGSPSEYADNRYICGYYLR